MKETELVAKFQTLLCREGEGIMDKSAEAIFWFKEFSKSWVHVVSDEVVYQEQVLEQDSGWVTRVCGGRTYIKDYLSSNLWLEIVFKIRRGMEFELYTALIETSETVRVKPLRTTQPSGDINFSQARKNYAMFVNVVNYTENPEWMPSPLPIRYVIRLNRFNISPYVVMKAFKSADKFRILLNVNWKDSACISFDGKRPSDVIKGGTQTVSNFAYQKSPCFRESIPEIRAKDITSILRVFFNGTSIRLTCEEGFNFSVEDIKVFLRPIDSSEGVSHWLHMLSPCE